MNFKRLSLTDIKIDIKRIPKKKTLIAAMEAAGKCGYIFSYRLFGVNSTLAALFVSLICKKSL